MLSRFFSALVSVHYFGFSGQAFCWAGDHFLLQSIAVVVLGGTLITSKRGHYIRILASALLFTMLGTLLPEAVRSIIYGVMLIDAIVALRECAIR